MEQLILENGLEFFTYPLENTHSVVLGVYFNAGSAYEPYCRNGISHLVEHLFFRKLKELNQYELYKRVNKIGGNMNGATSHEVVYFQIEVVPKYIEKAGNLFCKLLEDFIWTDQDLEAEMGVVLKQLEYNSDSSFWSYSDQLYFKGSKYALPIMGTEETVKNCTVEYINKWKRDYFHPGNACCVVTGNITPEQVQLLKHSFGSIKRWKSKRTSSLSEGIVQNKYHRTILDDKICPIDNHISNVSITFDVDCTLVSRTETFLLNSILGEGIGSRLSMLLREKYAFTDDVFTEVLEHRGHRNIKIEFLVENCELERCLSVLFLELHQIKENLSEEDLSTSIVYFTDNETFLMDDVPNLNTFIGWNYYILKQKTATVQEIIEDYKSVSVKDLKRAASIILKSSNLKIVVSNNNKVIKKERLKSFMQKVRCCL